MLRTLSLLLAVGLLQPACFAKDQSQTSSDSLYREIIRTVENADFDAMAATYHDDAVLVSLKQTMPISVVIPKWKAAGEKHSEAGGAAFLTFRFSSRLSSGKTAFETGIFRYGTRDSNGVEKVSYTHFQNLLIMKDDQWLSLMERQMDPASLDEWDALPIWK
jgi:ketosteroid isomerase-like protein